MENMKKEKHIKKRILDFETVFLKEKDEKYSVNVPFLPGCFSQGDTLEEAVVNIKEAIGLYLQDERDLIVPKRSTRKEFTIPVRVNV